MTRGRHGKNPSAPVSSRATRSTTVTSAAGPASHEVDVSDVMAIPKLRIPAGKHSHSATPTATRVSSPTRSEGSLREITPAPELSKAEVRAALNSLRQGGLKRAGVVDVEFTESERSESDVEMLEDAEVKRAWSPLLQPDSDPPRRSKAKRKRGVSDVSRDQVSSEESSGPAVIDEEEEAEEEEAEEEEVEEEEVEEGEAEEEEAEEEEAEEEEEEAEEKEEEGTLVHCNLPSTRNLHYPRH